MLTLFEAAEPLPITYRSLLQRLAITVAVVAATIALRHLLDPALGDQFPYGFSLLAVALAAWFGGVAQGLLATALGGFLASYLFTPPRYTLWIEEEALVPLLAFVATGLLLAAIAGWYRRDLRNAGEKMLEMQQRVQQLRYEQSSLQSLLERATRVENSLSEERDDLKQRLAQSEGRLIVAEQSARLVLFDWQQREQTMVLVGDPKPVFGMAAEGWQGLETLYQLLHEEDRERTQEAFAKALAEQRQLDLEFRVRAPDGRTQWVAVKGTTSYDLFGRPLRTIGIFQDITAKKATEQALVRNEKLAAAGRLAASIAHEINNPLAAVTNLLFILRDDRSLSQAGRQYLAMAEQELARVGQIAKQTLGFYKESANAVTVNVAELLEEVVGLYARNMPSTVKVDKQYASGCEIRALRGELQQVFSNLISNALNAVGDSGTLRLVTRPGRENGRAGVMVEVADNGPGIPSEHMASVFEPFFTTRPGVGTGLGLWVAKGIVEKHGGEMKVESSTDEKKHGTCFRVFLPAAVEQERAGRTSAA